jgi:hypothetical protein|uniref:Uncharacterized protein n=1 Tax=Picea glauca TaxID=3330 RepID=A0A101M0K2_PICGL|nr:hypothetical protein ABT39_MTgene4722 [Picea glauca]QHR91299.1 hypothetical protein Q903MT_gene5331 [Picea sitchensis]
MLLSTVSGSAAVGYETGTGAALATFDLAIATGAFGKGGLDQDFSTI